jgi:uncharacterized protein YodC (DUF2158 family)
MQDQNKQKLPESAPRAQEELKLGDIVHLNSGSPPLTVKALAWANAKTGDIEVTWVDREGRSQSLEAPVACFTREVRDASN